MNTDITKQPDTFSLRQQVFDADPDRKLMTSKWLTVASGLTWQEAKAKRNASRPVKLIIVKE